MYTKKNLLVLITVVSSPVLATISTVPSNAMTMKPKNDHIDKDERNELREILNNCLNEKKCMEIELNKFKAKHMKTEMVLTAMFLRDCQNIFKNKVLFPIYLNNYKVSTETMKEAYFNFLFKRNKRTPEDLKKYKQFKSESKYEKRVQKCERISDAVREDLTGRGMRDDVFVDALVTSYPVACRLIEFFYSIYRTSFNIDVFLDLFSDDSDLFTPEQITSCQIIARFI